MENEFIFIPEIRINGILNSVLDFMENDYNSTQNKSDTLLYGFFYGQKLGRFDFYEQAVELFTRDKGSTRKLEIHIGYNLERAATPSIHIMMPSETPRPAPIGGGEGYENDIVDKGKRTSTSVYTYENDVAYNLLLTSDNALEVLLMYSFFKFTLTSVFTHFEIDGFHNIKFGGSDLSFVDELVPPNIFHRNFNISFEFDYSVQSAFVKKYGEKIKLNSVINTIET